MEFLQHRIGQRHKNMVAKPAQRLGIATACVYEIFVTDQQCREPTLIDALQETADIVRPHVDRRKWVLKAPGEFLILDGAVGGERVAYQEHDFCIGENCMHEVRELCTARTHFLEAPAGEPGALDTRPIKRLEKGTIGCAEFTTTRGKCRDPLARRRGSHIARRWRARRDLVDSLLQC